MVHRYNTRATNEPEVRGEITDDAHFCVVFTIETTIMTMITETETPIMMRICDRL